MIPQAKPFSIHRAANDQDLTPVLHRTTLSLVRREGADLTARQLGIFLTVYLDDGQHTVRGLASLFNICKPAVTRALDKLGELGLVRRKVDPRDRRSVLVHRTELGWAFLGDLRHAMGQAAEDAGWRPAAPPQVAAAPWPGAIAARRARHGAPAHPLAD